MQAALRYKVGTRTRLQAWMPAIANKHARMLWAILAHGEDCDPNAWQRHPLARP